MLLLNNVCVLVKKEDRRKLLTASLSQRLLSRYTGVNPLWGKKSDR